MLPFYIYVGCGAAALFLTGYMVGKIVGEDQADERARRAAQDREARVRGVVPLAGGRRR